MNSMGIVESIEKNKVIDNNIMHTKLERFYWNEVKKLGFLKSGLAIDQSKLDQVILAYIENEYHKSGAGMFIQGEINAGKTSHMAYLAYRIVKSCGFYGVADHPEMSDYWSSPAKDSIMYLSLIEILTNLSRSTDLKLVDFIKKASKVDYLFIDDIDRVDDSHSLIRLENILERRCANGLCNIVSSNTKVEKLQSSNYFSRIIRLLADSAQFVELESTAGQVEIMFA